MYSSKAEKDRELKALGKQFEDIRDWIMSEILEDKGSLGHLYWDAPDYLHQWSKKVIDKFSPFFPEKAKQIEDLKNLRDEIKAAPVCKPSPASSKEKEIVKDIKELLEKRREDYARGLRLAEHFGELHVSVNAHLVRNQHGTEFVRCFFYLEGKVTALQTIIAVVEKSKKEGFIK